MNSYKFSITRRSLHESGGWIEHGTFTAVVQARNPSEATNMVQAQYGNSKIQYLGPA
jgi:hypothetical protein